MTLFDRVKRLPLGNQIALACVAISLLAIVVVSTVYSSVGNRHLRGKLDARAVLYAYQLRRQLAPVVAFDDAVTAHEIFESFALDTDVAGLAVYTAGGEVIDGVGHYPHHMSPDEVPDAAGQGLIVVIGAVTSMEGARGQLYVSLSTARIRRSQLEMIWIAGGTGAVALFISIALAIPIARHVTRRLSRIVDAAACIARGDFTQPPIEDAGRDQIGVLAGAVNTMSAELRRLFTELGEFHETRHLRDLQQHALLERLVVERTSSLEESRAEVSRLAERLTLATDAAGIGVWEWDLSSNALRWNDQMYLLYGQTPFEGVEPYSLWATSLHAEDRERAEREINDAIRRNANFDTEFRIVLSSGEIRHMKAAAQIQYDVAGVAIRMIGVNIDITKGKILESQLADAARRDKLTGLANRDVFMDRLTSAVARVKHGEQPLLAVLFLDFDRFKLVNDTLGHNAGDELLRQIARRLQQELRASDSVAGENSGNVVSRFGGDEFLLLVNDLGAAGDATRIAERLLDALAPAYVILGVEVNCSASIGIMISEHGELSAEEVVRNADVAMYAAKRIGRSSCVVFNEAMHAQVTRNVTIESSLRRGIATNELELLEGPVSKPAVA